MPKNIKVYLLIVVVLGGVAACNVSAPRTSSCPPVIDYNTDRTMGEIRSTIECNKAEFKRIYDSILDIFPNASAEFVVSIIVGSNGVPLKCEVIEGVSNFEPLKNQFVKSICRLNFGAKKPEIDSSKVTIEYPFTLIPR